jgi:hypothetical protein
MSVWFALRFYSVTLGNVEVIAFEAADESSMLARSWMFVQSTLGQKSVRDLQLNKNKNAL